MAQGTRGRLALLGTGLLACLGCLESEPKPVQKTPPVAKSQMGANTKPPATPGMTYAGGVQQAGGFGQTKTDTFGNGLKPLPSGGTGGPTTFAPPAGNFQPTPPGSFNATGLGGPAGPMLPNYGPGGPVPPLEPGTGGAFAAPPMTPTGAVNPLGK